MDKRFWAVIAAIIVIFGGIVWANNRKQDSTSTSGGTTSASKSNHVRGDNAKNVTVIEYGDFQCPVCSVYAPVVEQVVDKYQADIKFQFVNFPLQQIHINAFAAARAAEAAGLQGKYWDMNHLIYQNQNSWSAAADPISTFTGYAEALSLDTAKFKTDFSSSKVNDIINADLAEATKLKLTGTPAFTVNGKDIELKELVADDGTPSVDKFSKVIDDAIKAQEAKASKDTDNSKPATE